MISQVSIQQTKLFNNYEKDGTKKAYPELYHLLEMLDRAASGYNRIWEQRYEDAVVEFSMIDVLPMKKSDQPLMKSKLFTQLDPNLRELILTVLLSIARLIRHVHYKISNETARFQDASKAAQLKYQKLDEYKELLQRLVLYLDLLRSSVPDQNTIDRATEIAEECRRIQIEVA